MDKSHIRQEILYYVAAEGHVALEAPTWLFEHGNLAHVDKKQIVLCLFELVSEGKLKPTIRKGEFIHLVKA